jgi:hypothetical protein
MLQWQTGSSKHGSFHGHTEHKEGRKVKTKENAQQVLSSERRSRDGADHPNTLSPLGQTPTMIPIYV